MTPIEVLASVIEETSAWTWWVVSGDSVQLEFTSPQLARRGEANAIPTPLVSLALRFGGVHEFAFLTRSDAESVPEDWPSRMADDSLDFDAVPTSLSFEHLALNHYGTRERVFAIPHRREWLMQSRMGPAESSAKYELAFWAGQVGAVVRAESMEVHTHEGPLDPSTLAELQSLWWEYWRTYWHRRGSSDPLQYDPICETIIPLK